MRLLPKHIFFGIVAFGLPVALTTGWALGVPTPLHGPVVPVGEGGLGAAPDGSAPVPAVPSSTVRRPAPARTPVAVVSTSAQADRPTRTAPPRPTTTYEPPPVPTPTGATGTPSPDPTDSTPTATVSPSPESRRAR